jgi:hypothetical protein
MFSTAFYRATGQLIGIHLVAMGIALVTGVLGFLVKDLPEGNDFLHLAIAIGWAIAIWFATTIILFMLRFVRIAIDCANHPEFSVDPGSDILDGIRSLPEELKRSPVHFFK